jgi:hypothetical protein
MEGGTLTDTTMANEAPTVERTPEEIQTEIDAAQRRLADNVDALSDRIRPEALLADIKEKVRNTYLDENGEPKSKPIAITAGGLSAFLVLRKIFHR